MKDTGKVLDILRDIRPEFTFDDSDDFIRDGMLDSLDVLTLVSELDQRFGVSISGRDIVPENFASVPAMLALLSRHGASE